MNQTTVADLLGTRIVSAARLAVEIHLTMSDQQQGSKRSLEQMAMIGGTDRRVTDDPLSLSVVSGPLSVAADPNN